eukprot:UN02495
MKVLLILVLALLALSVSAGKITSCNWKSPTGKSYNFQNKNAVSAEQDGYDSSFFWCKGTPSSQYSECARDGGVGCLYRSNQYFAVTAKWDGQNEGPISIIETKAGLEITFDNAGMSETGLRPNLQIFGYCDKNQRAEQASAMSLSIWSPKFCPSTADDGLSGGAVFLIIVLSVWAAYFIFGFLFFKFYLKKTTITESIPHFGFWSSLPGFYIAGCKVAISFVQSKIGKKGASEGSSYESYGAADDAV